MASGDIVGFIYKESPPATLFPQPYVRAGGSTPAERVPVYGFDASTDEFMDFYVHLQGYDGGGLTCTIEWSAASATTGVTRWGVAVRRIQDDAEDVDAAHTYDYNEADDTTASASGETSKVDITFTNGADMDSWADGESAIARVTRNADHANDTMTGDAELWKLIIKET